MFIFSKKNRKDATSNDFRTFVCTQTKYPWVAEYIDERGAFLADLFFNHSADPRKKAFGWGEKEMRNVLVQCFTQYMGGSRVAYDDLVTIGALENLPIGTEIRRVMPHQAGNKWSISYRGGVLRYGKTLHDAIRELKTKDARLVKALKRSRR